MVYDDDGRLAQESQSNDREREGKEQRERMDRGKGQEVRGKGGLSQLQSTGAATRAHE